jgi:hypothetical protein
VCVCVSVYVLGVTRCGSLLKRVGMTLIQEANTKSERFANGLSNKNFKKWGLRLTEYTCCIVHVLIHHQIHNIAGDLSFHLKDIFKHTDPSVSTKYINYIGVEG